MKITIVTVGKLRDKALLEIENEYKKRLKVISLEFVELKNFGDHPEKEINEIKNYLKAHRKPNSPVYLLEEKGKLFNSVEFSKQLNHYKDESQSPIFIIAGAQGFPSDFSNQYPLKLSLSPLTFPHQMAKIILVEQIYRAETLMSGHPYHN